jgi:hypothetical protein
VLELLDERSTIEVIHGSLRAQPVSLKNQRTLRAPGLEFSTCPDTASSKPLTTRWASANRRGDLAVSRILPLREVFVCSDRCRDRGHRWVQDEASCFQGRL